MKNPALIALFALSSLALSARPALANDVNPYNYANDPRWQYVSSDSICEPDSFSKMFPFSLNKDLSAPVDDIVMSTYLLNFCLPLGGLWGPLVTLPDGHPDMGEGDVVSSYLVPYVAGWATVVVLGSFVIGLVGCVPMAYNAPTAALNGWDRAYKCSGKAPHKKAPKSQPKAESGGDEGYAY